MSSTLPANAASWSGDTAWVLASTSLVMLMIPGLGYFYSGLAAHKNALSLIFLSMLSLAVVSFQWWVWGFSLAFSPTGSSFIGNLQHAFFMGLFESPANVHPLASTIPTPVFVIFQGMFAAITPALAFGGSAERTRIIPAFFLIFIWTTLVYDFIAYWTWSKAGWLHALGALDFAGGSPVHIASGAAGLAMAIRAGKRHGWGTSEFKPHNLSSVFLGTALLWFGWFGFNGGSAVSANAQAAIAVVNTNLAASVAGLTWTGWEYMRSKHFSAFAFCSGAVAGLVAVTPACGFVPTWASVIIGLVGATACYWFVRFKHHYGFDDALDVFGIHGVGGIVGDLMTGIFASKSVAALGGLDIAGGWIDGNFMQILYQLTSSTATLAWSFIITYLIVFVIDLVPNLNWRLSVDDELMGVDKSQLGASAYDYIEAAVRWETVSPDMRGRSLSTENEMTSESFQMAPLKSPVQADRPLVNVRIEPLKGESIPADQVMIDLPHSTEEASQKKA